MLHSGLPWFYKFITESSSWNLLPAQSIAEMVRMGNIPYAQGCVSLFCAACLLVRGGGDEPRGGRLRRGKESSQESRREKSKMQPEDLHERWKEQGEGTFAAVAQWRAAHPQATLAEIEQAVD